ncbi:heme exporter protein CcmD [Thalassomonas actiniarum]|uniref:Heme exporter protein D n=1 Tax=Thalassomonas actiniarum TaxID=485447 RepID=A0AAF0C370_9GAMM|nr:heme exporter protein CcmD [Thalassomonas actiniarum]WDD98663.1 heme exporter protein CcmD [Thalassomonas actiniarum]
MQFDSFSDFLHMGGYGFYVWLSYGVGFVLLLLLFLISKAQHNSVKQQIAKRQQREAKLRQAAEQHKQEIQQENKVSTEVSS